eukprot:TRINITY_DN3512_c0_g1_i1.p1 TRINITY_DN3512_c0_g1~~TRINITY_DN3512_c0_g1_i1.p1  ORF type:complete len:244 (+),score=54.31 TRINITY_DN3512_c0_g1_i1:70-801(+)
MDSVPNEIYFEIFSFVRFQGLDWLNVKSTCKRWKQIADVAFNPKQVRALQRMLDVDAKEESIIKLLEDERIDPSAEMNRAIRIASQKGWIELVNRLLEDHRVDPSCASNAPIRSASSNGHAQIVIRLLCDGRVDPSAEGNHAVKIASAYGRADIVNILLQDKRVDPSDGADYAIINASLNRHIDVIKRLLLDERVNPNEAIRAIRTIPRRQSKDNRYAEVIMLLSKRFESSINGRDFLSPFLL